MNDLEYFETLCGSLVCLEDTLFRRALQTSMNTGELELSGYPIGIRLSEIIAKILQNSSAITCLKVGDCMILPMGLSKILSSIMNNKTLVELNLYGNSIHSPVTEICGKLLSVNQRIETLILNWNHLGASEQSFAAFCDGLAKNESIVYLDLRNNEINSEAAKHLAVCLQYNHTLTTLDLRWNKIGDNGICRLWESLKNNTTLRDVRLEGNLVHRTIYESVEQLVRHNESVQQLQTEYEMRLKQIQSECDMRLQQIQNEDYTKMQLLQREDDKKIQEMQIEYDLKIGQMLKDTKKMDEQRVEQIMKITEAFQNKIIDLEEKLEKTTDKLLKKDEALKSIEMLRSKIEKKFINEQKKVSVLKNELASSHDIIKSANTALEEQAIQIKYSEEESKMALAKEKEENNKLVKELKEEREANSRLGCELSSLAAAREAEIREEKERSELELQKKFKDVEEKYTMKLDKYKVDYEKDKELEIDKLKCLLVETEKQVIKFQEIAEIADKNKHETETKLTTFQDQIKKFEEEVCCSSNKLTKAYSDLETVRNELKVAKLRVKKATDSEEKVKGVRAKLRKEIEAVQNELESEREKGKMTVVKLREAKAKLSRNREEEKLRVKLLSSALKRYVGSAPDSSKSSSVDS